MDPLTCLLSLSVFIIVLAISKYVSLGSICAAIAYPLFTIITQTIRGIDGRMMNFIMTAFIGILIVYMHKPNIKRLMAGTENKFGQKKKNPVENDAPDDRQ